MTDDPHPERRGSLRYSVQSMLPSTPRTAVWVDGEFVAEGENVELRAVSPEEDDATE